ncbi:MAG: BolA family transcriptional regulator [Methylohalobius sp.]|nr:BolA family transcriptional regulator [Methylohalobius sp.]
MKNRVQLIEDKLRLALAPTYLEVVDESLAHLGHAQAGGAGHFSVIVVSSAFAGKTLIQRHQLVYQSLSDLMPSQIHALRIKAYTPDEFSTAKG